jgi:predicted MPP superfamily phosphohydrolase
MMAIGSTAQQAPISLPDSSTRKQTLQTLGLLAGLGAGLSAGFASYAFFHEPLRVHLDRLTIRLPGTSGCLPAEGIHVLQLSDTHFGGHDWREHAKIESIRRACANLHYDLLVHTGDFLQTDSGLDNVISLFDSLPAPRLGAFAVLGNHDYTTYSHHEMFKRGWNNFCRDNPEATTSASTYHRTWARSVRFAHFIRYMLDRPLDLERVGYNDVDRLAATLGARDIQLLTNRHVRLVHDDGPAGRVDLYIAGVDDVSEGVPSLRRALDGIPGHAPTLLLSHNPDILLAPGVDRADVVLSGHTHGGQIVLPLLGAAHTHSDYLHRRAASGYLPRGKTHLYVSRGIGEGIPLRFGAAPEIALITIRPA